MKKIVLFLLLLTSSLFSQTKILSWNLENFGKSKSNGEITFIANTVKDYDIVAIQEVVGRTGTTPYAWWVSRLGLWPWWALCAAVLVLAGGRARRL